MKRHTHLGVYAVALDATRILLVLKGRGPYAGSWDLPGGGIEFGEEPIEALRREMNEETGIEFSRHRLLDIFSHRVEHAPPDGEPEDLHHVGIILWVETDGGSLRTGPGNEDTRAASWVELKEAVRLPLTPFAGRSIELLNQS